MLGTIFITEIVLMYIGGKTTTPIALSKIKMVTTNKIQQTLIGVLHRWTSRHTTHGAAHSVTHWSSTTHGSSAHTAWWGHASGRAHALGAHALGPHTLIAHAHIALGHTTLRHTTVA